MYFEMLGVVGDEVVTKLSTPLYASRYKASEQNRKVVIDKNKNPITIPIKTRLDVVSIYVVKPDNITWFRVKYAPEGFNYIGWIDESVVVGGAGGAVIPPAGTAPLPGRHIYLKQNTPIYATTDRSKGPITTTGIGATNQSYISTATTTEGTKETGGSTITWWKIYHQESTGKIWEGYIVANEISFPKAIPPTTFPPFTGRVTEMPGSQIPPPTGPAGLIPTTTADKPKDTTIYWIIGGLLSVGVIGTGTWFYMKKKGKTGRPKVDRKTS
jgi:hypothetical protein